MGYVWGSLILCIGIAIGAWFARKTNDECCQCSQSYLEELAELKKRNKELEERLICKNISNGKLGVQLYKQTMAR